MNVLFLSIEDLNDFVEPLGGYPGVSTPNIARLAARGALFERAYAASPACSPSRTSVLFGQAPWRTGVYVNRHRWDAVYPKGRRLSLAGRAKEAGFETHGAGKVFFLAHDGVDPDEWDAYHATRRGGARRAVGALRHIGFLGAQEDYGPVPNDEVLYDQINADWIAGRITRDADNQFWALGLYRPHLPWLVQQRFFDIYPDDPAPPPGLDAAFDPYDDRQIAGLPSEAREMIARRGLGRKLHEAGEYGAFLRAYLASISFADHLVGALLDRLAETGQDGNTLIVLWSDHGMQFGEKLAFSKFTLWERALRVPLIFAGPGIAPRRIGQPVSLMDIYPTLAAKMGAPLPHDVDGADLTPLLDGAAENPDAAALSIWGKLRDGEEPDRLAISVRSATRRYTRYWRGGEELYDHESDPHEKRNRLAGLARFNPKSRRDAASLRTRAPLDFARSVAPEGVFAPGPPKGKSP